MMTGFGMGFSYFGLFLMVLFWGGLIALAVLAVRTLFHSSSHDRNFPSTANPTAREILDQRYAKGEITRQDYERMKADLAE